jgi:hypothetical protein
MLSPVLQQQYSGDYLEDGSQYRFNPEISIMYYQTGNPETGETKVESKFTGLFNNTDELLKLCTGHAVWVDEGNRSDSDFTIHYPKDSAQYCYYDKSTNHVTRVSDTMERDKRGRFIYEGNDSFETNGDGSFSQPIENSNNYPNVIVGNPYMSHFDIVEFQRVNDTYLKKSFYIWNMEGGISYETFLVGDTDNIITTGNESPTIAPMQSFIIATKNLFTDSLLFTSDMSVIEPGITLKNNSGNTISNVLKVEVLREGIRQSGVALRYKEGESNSYDEKKDVWTMIPKNVGNHVSLYSLVDGGAAAIHTTGDITTPIELGITVGSSIKKSIDNGNIEDYTIQIASGSENTWDKNTVYLLDTSANNTIHNLSESAYHFQNVTGDVSGRFWLFTKTTTTNLDIPDSDSSVSIKYVNGQLQVTSSENNPIRSINVYNVVGRLICLFPHLNVWNYSFHLPEENTVIIVKVQTERSSKTEKIMLK